MLFLILGLLCNNFSYYLSGLTSYWFQEPDPDEEAENEPEEGKEPKKRLIFPGKTLSKKKKKKKTISKLVKASQDEKGSEQSTPSEHHDTTDDLEKERTIRKSTRTAVIVRQAEREAIHAALQATTKVLQK